MQKASILKPKKCIMNETTIFSDSHIRIESIKMPNLLKPGVILDFLIDVNKYANSIENWYGSFMPGDVRLHVTTGNAPTGAKEIKMGDGWDNMYPVHKLVDYCRHHGPGEYTFYVSNYNPFIRMGGPKS